MQPSEAALIPGPPSLLPPIPPPDSEQRIPELERRIAHLESLVPAYEFTYLWTFIPLVFAVLLVGEIANTLIRGFSGSDDFLRNSMDNEDLPWLVNLVINYPKTITGAIFGPMLAFFIGALFFRLRGGRKGKLASLIVLTGALLLVCAETTGLLSGYLQSVSLILQLDADSPDVTSSSTGSSPNLSPPKSSDPGR